MAQEIFKRYELKYLITRAEHEALREAILGRMAYDTYGDPEGKYNIVSLYFESDQKDIYFETMNKLRFRQKLRLRVYDQATLASPSFIEIKQKFTNVVNKRRTVIPLHEAYDVLSQPFSEEQSGSIDASNPQILREALHFRDLYALKPATVVSYDRQAFSGTVKGEEDLRVTFDYNLMCRDDDLSIENGPEGTYFTDPNLVILEVKVSNSVPFWLARILSEFEFYKQGFSKFCTSMDVLEGKIVPEPFIREVLT
ncbi:MAG TPA: polyphosphate polymerase domain-containing protein [Bacillota bacterium]|nr:polyphosphate polymerase domain-containing protein [Bacillota bacterium]